MQKRRQSTPEMRPSAAPLLHPEYGPEHEHLIVRRASAEIHFWQADTEELARHDGDASSCHIRATGIEGLDQELKARGAKFRYGLTKQLWGMNEMQIDDPDGNAIRFGEAVD